MKQMPKESSKVDSERKKADGSSCQVGLCKEENMKDNQTRQHNRSDGENGHDGKRTEEWDRADG